ncbi:MAG TPA: peroxiredoxin [Bauldia sp.]|nr:peroxiredoxin [Bauldia sp.]
MLKVGDRLPEASFRVKADDGSVKQVTTAEYFGGKKVVLVGVPGAFTSTCHNSHVPTFISNLDQLKSRGIDKVAVVAVNDHHVMKAWAQALGADGKIDFLADGSGVFTRAIDLVNDLNGTGLGYRSKRFAMIVDDGVVKSIDVEPDSGKVTVSSAASVLSHLH